MGRETWKEGETEEQYFTRMLDWGVPHSLAKACCDPFDYAMGLRDGTVIHFNTASIHGQWVHLSDISHHNVAAVTIYDPNKPPHVFNFERGLDVRLTEIAWCADAPHGS